MALPPPPQLTALPQKALPPPPQLTALPPPPQLTALPPPPQLTALTQGMALPPPPQLARGPQTSMATTTRRVSLPVQLGMPPDQRFEALLAQVRKAAAAPVAAAAPLAAATPLAVAATPAVAVATPAPDAGLAADDLLDLLENDERDPDGESMGHELVAMLQPEELGELTEELAQKEGGWGALGAGAGTLGVGRTPPLSPVSAGAAQRRRYSARYKWTPALQFEFEATVARLGGLATATASTVAEHMRPVYAEVAPNQSQVKSHLEAYRKQHSAEYEKQRRDNPLLSVSERASAHRAATAKRQGMHTQQNAQQHQQQETKRKEELAASRAIWRNAEKETETARVTQEKEEKKARVAQEKETEKARIAQEKEKEKARIAQEKEDEKARVAQSIAQEKARVAQEKEKEMARFVQEEEKEKARRFVQKEEKEKARIAQEKEKEKEKARIAQEKEKEKARIAQEKEDAEQAARKARVLAGLPALTPEEEAKEKKKAQHVEKIRVGVRGKLPSNFKAAMSQLGASTSSLRLAADGAN